MALTVSTTPRNNDPRLKLLQRILQGYQNQAGSNPRNTLRPTDTLRGVLRKIVRATNGG